MVMKIGVEFKSSKSGIRFVERWGCWRLTNVGAENGAHSATFKSNSKHRVSRTLFTVYKFVNWSLQS